MSEIYKEALHRLGRIEDKIDRLDGRIDTMEITQERLTTTVELHEKRSTTLEKNHSLCKVTCDQQIADLSKLVEAITQTMQNVKKIILWTSGGVAFISSLIQIIAFIIGMRK